MFSTGSFLCGIIGEMEITEEDIANAVFAFQDSYRGGDEYGIGDEDAEAGILAALESLGIERERIAEIRAARVSQRLAEDAENERRRIEKRAATPPDILAMQDRTDTLLTMSLLGNRFLTGQAWKGIFDFNGTNSSSPQTIPTTDTPKYKRAEVVEKPNE